MNAISATDTGLPEGTLGRLALFAEWTSTDAPTSIFTGTGPDEAFSDEFREYAVREGLSFDWVLFGDVRGLVMTCRAYIRGEA